MREKSEGWRGVCWNTSVKKQVFQPSIFQSGSVKLPGGHPRALLRSTGSPAASRGASLRISSSYARPDSLCSLRQRRFFRSPDDRKPAFRRYSAELLRSGGLARRRTRAPNGEPGKEGGEEEEMLFGGLSCFPDGGGALETPLDRPKSHRPRGQSPRRQDKATADRGAVASTSSPRNKPRAPRVKSPPGRQEPRSVFF